MNNRETIDKEYTPEYIRATFNSLGKRPPVKGGILDGVSAINVFIGSTSDLGSMLAPEHPYPVDTVKFGVAGNIRNALDLVTINNYPVHLLSKARLTKADISQIPKGGRIIPPNIEAITLFFVGNRILKNRKVMELMYKNKLPYVAYSVRKTTTSDPRYKYINSGEHLVYNRVDKLDTYITCIMYMDAIVRKLHDEKITKQEAYYILDKSVEELMVDKSDLYAKTAPIVQKLSATKENVVTNTPVPDVTEDKEQVTA